MRQIVGVSFGKDKILAKSVEMLDESLTTNIFTIHIF